MSDLSQRTKLAILFADISGSTALYDKLGDTQALGLVAKCLDILSADGDKVGRLLAEGVDNGNKLAFTHGERLAVSGGNMDMLLAHSLIPAG